MRPMPPKTALSSPATSLELNEEDDESQGVFFGTHTLREERYLALKETDTFRGGTDAHLAIDKPCTPRRRIKRDSREFHRRKTILVDDGSHQWPEGFYEIKSEAEASSSVSKPIAKGPRADDGTLGQESGSDSDKENIYENARLPQSRSQTECRNAENHIQFSSHRSPQETDDEDDYLSMDMGGLSVDDFADPDDHVSLREPSDSSKGEPETASPESSSSLEPSAPHRFDSEVVQTGFLSRCPISPNLNAAKTGFALDESSFETGRAVSSQGFMAMSEIHLPSLPPLLSMRSTHEMDHATSLFHPIDFGSKTISPEHAETRIVSHPSASTSAYRHKSGSSDTIRNEAYRGFQMTLNLGKTVKDDEPSNPSQASHRIGLSRLVSPTPSRRAPIKPNGMRQQNLSHHPATARKGLSVYPATTHSQTKSALDRPTTSFSRTGIAGSSGASSRKTGMPNPSNPATIRSGGPVPIARKLLRVPLAHRSLDQDANGMKVTGRFASTSTSSKSKASIVSAVARPINKTSSMLPEDDSMSNSLPLASAEGPAPTPVNGIPRATLGLPFRMSRDGVAQIGRGSAPVSQWKALTPIIRSPPGKTVGDLTLTTPQKEVRTMGTPSRHATPRSVARPLGPPLRASGTSPSLSRSQPQSARRSADTIFEALIPHRPDRADDGSALTGTQIPALPPASSLPLDPIGQQSTSAEAAAPADKETKTTAKTSSSRRTRDRKPPTTFLGHGRKPLSFVISSGISEKELQTTTSRNTMKNEVYHCAIDRHVVRVPGPRPPSPTAKVRTIADRDEDERRGSRNARAQRRAQTSGSIAPDESGPQVIERIEWKRGAGEEDDWVTPARPMKKAKSTFSSKTVQWDHGLTVIRDNGLDSERLHDAPDAPFKSCLRGDRNIELDRFGNITSDLREKEPMSRARVVVTAVYYDGEEPVYNKKA